MAEGLTFSSGSRDFTSRPHLKQLWNALVLKLRWWPDVERISCSKLRLSSSFFLFIEKSQLNDNQPEVHLGPGTGWWRRTPPCCCSGRTGKTLPDIAEPEMSELGNANKYSLQAEARSLFIKNPFVLAMEVIQRVKNVVEVLFCKTRFRWHEGQTKATF